MTMETHEYPVHLTWTTGRRGQLTAPEIDHPLEVATPPEFPSGVAGVWSPEHYYTAAVVSCFMTTFLAIAEMSKLSYVSFECASKGILSKDENNHYLMSKVVLMPTLVIDREEDVDKAERILQKAEKACLITNSIKSEVELHTTVQLAEVAHQS